MDKWKVNQDLKGWSYSRNRGYSRNRRKIWPFIRWWRQVFWGCLSRALEAVTSVGKWSQQRDQLVEVPRTSAFKVYSKDSKEACGWSRARGVRGGRWSQHSKGDECERRWCKTWALIPDDRQNHCSFEWKKFSIWCDLKAHCHLLENELERAGEARAEDSWEADLVTQVNKTLPAFFCRLEKMKSPCHAVATAFTRLRSHTQSQRRSCTLREIVYCLVTFVLSGLKGCRK